MGYREEREECKDRDEAPDAEQGMREVQQQPERRAGEIKTQGHGAGEGAGKRGRRGEMRRN